MSTDLSALPAIEIAAGELFREVGMADIAEHDPPTIADLSAAEALWVAVADDQLLGYAWAETVDGHAHLEQLSVLPDHRRLGIGTALIQAVTTWARDRGDDVVTLTTFRDLPFNAPLYAKRGFVEIAEADWAPDLRALVAEEATHGLDPASRVVMARPTRPQ